MSSNCRSSWLAWNIGRLVKSSPKIHLSRDGGERKVRHCTAMLREIEISTCIGVYKWFLLLLLKLTVFSKAEFGSRAKRSIRQK